MFDTVTVIWKAVKKSCVNFIRVDGDYDEFVTINIEVPHSEMFNKKGFLNVDNILLKSIDMLSDNFAVEKDTVYNVYVNGKCYAKGSFESIKVV